MVIERLGCDAGPIRQRQNLFRCSLDRDETPVLIPMHGRHPLGGRVKRVLTHLGEQDLLLAASQSRECTGADQRDLHRIAAAGVGFDVIVGVATQHTR